MALFSNVIRWRFGRFGVDEFRNPRRGFLALRAFRKVLMGGGPFRIKIRSQAGWGVSRDDIGGTMDRIGELMPKIQVGDSILVELSDGVVWALRKSRERLRLPIKDTQGNDDIDKIYTWALNAFKKVGSLGICARRQIAGTSSWSEHSPWKAPDPGANAWDITWPTLAQQVAAVKKLVHAAERNEIPMGYIISWMGSDTRQWKKGEGWSSYNGLDQHKSHAHAQGLKWHSGQTPAASC